MTAGGALDRPPSQVVGRDQATPVVGEPRRGSWSVRIGQVLVLVAAIGLWQTAVSLRWVTRLLLPPPLEVFDRFLRDSVSVVTAGPMLEHFFVTVTEIVVSFGIVAVGGTILGLIIHEIAFVRLVLYPYIIAFSASPRIAFAPLFLIWFGFDMGSKIVMGVTIALFPVLVSTIAGLAATDDDKIRLMRVLGASRWKLFAKVRFWQALPYIFAGLQTAVVLATVGVVVGELSGGRRGLGYLVVLYQEDLDLAGTFSAILMLSLLGVLFYFVMHVLAKRVVFWVGERPVA